MSSVDRGVTISSQMSGACALCGDIILNSDRFRPIGYRKFPVGDNDEVRNPCELIRLRHSQLVGT